MASNNLVKCGKFAFAVMTGVVTGLIGYELRRVARIRRNQLDPISLTARPDTDGTAITPTSR